MIPACRVSDTKKHFWKKDSQRSRSIANSEILFFYCKWCQWIKTQVLTFKALEDGRIKQTVKEVFPEGQDVEMQELNSDMPEVETNV